MKKIVEIGLNPIRKENYVIVRIDESNKPVWMLLSGMKETNDIKKGVISNEKYYKISENFSYCAKTLKEVRKYI